jgi:hypothetical protein
VVGVALTVLAFAAMGGALMRGYRRRASSWDRSLALGALVALGGTGLQWVANYNLPVMSNVLYLSAAVAAGLSSAVDDG